MLAAMAALDRMLCIVCGVMVIVFAMIFGIMYHMKADCPVVVMMVRYRSRHQYDQYR